MIFQELKKIFAFKRLLLILVIEIIYFMLFFEKRVGLPFYNSNHIRLEVSRELKRIYGEELDEEEFRELSGAVFLEESEIDTWIKRNDLFRKYGMESYRDLLKIQDSLSDEIGSTLTSQISAQFTKEEQQAALDQIWREDFMAEILNAYNTEIHLGQPASYYKELPKQKQNRVEERNREEVYSLMSDYVMRNYRSMLPDFFIFLILSSVLFLVPYIVKDSMEGVNVLQYSFPSGRRFYWKKGAAVFIGTIFLFGAESGLFAFILIKNGAISYMNCYVSGFSSPFITFMKLTFGQYVIMSLAYIFLAGLSLAMITYCLSSCSHNYISAIALQIPVVISGIVISFNFMPHFAEITQNIMLMFMILLACILTAVVGNVTRFWWLKFYEQI